MAAEESARHDASRVAAIYLRMGPLSGVVKDALVSAYELARENYALGNPELVIEEMPLVALCPSCSAERRLESVQQLACPVCGTPTPQIVSGRELEVVALEIE